MTLDAPRPAIAAVVALILACLAMAVFTPGRAGANGPHRAPRTSRA